MEYNWNIIEVNFGVYSVFNDKHNISVSIALNGFKKSEIKNFIKQVHENSKNYDNNKNKKILKNGIMSLKTKDLNNYFSIFIAEKEFVIVDNSVTKQTRLEFILNSSAVNVFEKFANFCEKYLEKSSKTKTPPARQASPARQKSPPRQASPKRQESESPRRWRDYLVGRK